MMECTHSLSGAFQLAGQVMLSSGECAHLLHAISGLPVVDERHNDLNALLAHLIQDEVNRLEHRLIVHTCTAMCACQQQKA